MILSISNLTVSYETKNQWLDAVREVTLQIEPGQTYGLVGESGSGKSTLALAIMRYLPPNGAIRAGSIELVGRDVAALSEGEMQEVWRNTIRMVPQNPLSAMNPSLRVGEQVAETVDPALGQRDKERRVLELLEMVRLADPERVASSYPHQLSGGMQQRVMIAMALSGEPQLLVLDEPTTALDVTTEAAILELLRDLIRDRNTAVLYVSHNLGVVAQICDRVAVLYAGELVEDAGVEALYGQPLHPYTQGLLDSVPRLGENKREVVLRPIPGQIPQLDELPDGCIFTPRCPVAIDLCAAERPPLDSPTASRCVRCHRWPEIRAGEVNPHQPIPEAALAAPAANGPRETVLSVRELEKRFSVTRPLLDLLRGAPVESVRAVDGVDLEIKRGRTLGLVGESGSGKTTAARAVIGLIERSEGQVDLLNVPLAPHVSQRDRTMLRHLQMVFQNPEEALNPYRTVGDTLARTLRHLAGLSREEADSAVTRLLEAVRLSPTYRGRLPGELSGGEKQRVAIARAFASHPDLILFDESVSALDVSVQASILNLLNMLQRDEQSAYLFISHDLAVVGYLADEIAVIYLGHLMEVGPAEEIFKPPYHPYTEALLSAIPLPDPATRKTPIRLEGEIPSPRDIPTGCRFHTRCPRFLGDICVNEEPPWREGRDGHRIYCHIPLETLQEEQG